MGGDGEAPRIVRFADARRSRWRNGGGETAEVAVHPPGATLDAFGWRVSLATIRGDGPFSTFHNVDRTFALVDGGGLVLTVGTGRPTRLDVDAEPVRFAGEAPCACRLAGGPATALNVMTERGSFDCAVARYTPSQGLPRADAGVTLLVCGSGEVDTALGRLGRLDVLVMPAGSDVDVGPRGAATRALIASIWPVTASLPSRGP